jgi:hypothetical protein
MPQGKAEARRKTQSVCPQLTNGAKRLGLRQPSGVLRETALLRDPECANVKLIC